MSLQLSRPLQVLLPLTTLRLPFHLLLPRLLRLLRLQLLQLQKPLQRGFRTLRGLFLLRRLQEDQKEVH